MYALLIYYKYNTHYDIYFYGCKMNQGTTGEAMDPGLLLLYKTNLKTVKQISNADVRKSCLKPAN